MRKEEKILRADIIAIIRKTRLSQGIGHAIGVGK